MPWHSFIKAPEELTVLKPWKAYKDILICWILIITAVAFAYYFQTWYAYLTCFIVIGLQGNVMGNIRHDGVHNLIHPSKKVNDFISEWIIGAPSFYPFVLSRATHLQHHQHLAKESDVDRHWYASKNKHPAIMFLLFLVNCFFMIELITGFLKYYRAGKSSSNFVKKVIPLAITQTIILAIFFILFNHIWQYIVIYALPFLTLSIFLNALRSFSEHSDTEKDNVADKKGRLFTYVSNPIGRYIIGPANMNYHAEHHLNPRIPYYNLPKFRKYLKKHKLDKQITYRKSYIGHALKFYRWAANAKKA